MKRTYFLFCLLAGLAGVLTPQSFRVRCPQKLGTPSYYTCNEHRTEASTLKWMR